MQRNGGRIVDNIVDDKKLLGPYCLRAEASPCVSKLVERVIESRRRPCGLAVRVRQQRMSIRLIGQHDGSEAHASVLHRDAADGAQQLLATSHAHNGMVGFGQQLVAARQPFQISHFRLELRD